MKTIGYVSLSDPYHDRAAWSGTTYKLRESIEKAGFKVIWIPYTPSSKLVWWLSHIIRIFNKKSIQYGVYPLYLKSCAKSINLDLVANCDILFFPGMASIMRYLKVEKSFIYYSDATVHDMLDYYWFDVDRITRYFAERQEKWAIQHCTMKMSASTWAANTVRDYYGCDASKNHVLLLGANIDDCDLQNVEKKSFAGKLKILFSGVEWERKGAAIAIDAVLELNKRGIDAELIMCGLKEIPSDSIPLPSCVKNLGFLNKNKAEEYEKYAYAITDADIFLLPTKAECAGIVFCETSANGIPSFTYDTGGIPDYVVNGKNGYRLPLGSTGKDFADKIQDCINNNELTALSKQARDYYHEALNWSAWSEKFKKIMDAYFNK